MWNIQLIGILPDNILSYQGFRGALAVGLQGISQPTIDDELCHSLGGCYNDRITN